MSGWGSATSQRTCSSEPKMSHRRKPLSVETFKAHAAEDVLKAALTELGWKNVSAAASAGKGDCDIYWRGIDHGEPWILPKSSYLARIPGMSAISHKGELAKHLNRLRQFFPKDIAFCPQTWLLPEEQEPFEAHAHKQMKLGKTVTYIVKPDQGAQGEGIFLIQNPRDLYSIRLPAVIQEYISKPLLIRGLKFDLRLYVLVAGLDPPEVYLSHSGMVRFCTVAYQPPTTKNLHQTFMHLTNYSLNKRSKDYVHSEEGDKGSKQTFGSVLTELHSHGIDTEEIWSRISQLVCKTVITVLPQLMVERRAYMVENALQQPPKCFQVLGFDILLDDRLNPHLLEVNAHPSLRVDFEVPVKPGVVEYIPSPVDLEIKLPVVRDTLQIIGSKIRRVATPDHGCLNELLPAQLDEYSHLRVFERCADLFVQFVGSRGGVKVGSSAFRTFTRHCELCNAQFTNADVDILFIDVSHYHDNTPERNALTFHGFCYALTAIAKKLHKEKTLDTLTTVLDHCEAALASRQQKK